MDASVRKSDIDYISLAVPAAGKLPFCLDACHLSAPKIYGIALLVSSSADLFVSREESGHHCGASTRRG